ncbi:MAG: TrmH family RNA methyltransferase [Candidatus Rhabdochlamydia sp.]
MQLEQLNRVLSYTETEFLKLSVKMRHTWAARTLRYYHLEGKETLYRRIEAWLELPPINLQDVKALCDRYHFHMAQIGQSWQEHNLLAKHQKSDVDSTAPFLQTGVYLDNIRSAFNVGSIIRTVEAFRLGPIYFAKQTPYIDNSKVQKTSMFTFDKVSCYQDRSLEQLPKPLIALETVPNAPSLFEFSFPKECTLLLGNEEYGLSDQALSMADQAVQIPLYGFKQSLNVASAFAIVAAVISNQLR